MSMTPPRAEIFHRLAFSNLHWPGWTFDAAMQHPTRARIIDLIATHYPKKMEPIISIARIEREAYQAASQYADINAACPYPFETNAGRLFKQFFELAQQNMPAPTPSLTSKGTCNA